MVILTALFVGILSGLAAQSNDRLDELLGQVPARLDSTLYLLLASGSLISEDATPAAALSESIGTGLVAPDRHPDEPVSIQELSFLVMKTQKFEGGLEWRLLPSPRAAYRELAYHGLVNTSAGPERHVAGEEVIRTLNAVRAYQGGER